MPKALARWKAPEPEPYVEEALAEVGRTDLIPRFRHLLAQANKKRKGPKRPERSRHLRLVAKH